MSHFTSPKSELFFSKKDPLDPRWGEIFHFQKTSQTKGTGFVILGYPDDEGIQKNGGRPGAKEGPDHIRSWLYRMTPSRNPQGSFEDLGNLQDFEKDTLETRHAFASEKLQAALSEGKKALTFGGGHDYGFPDGLAFLNTFSEGKDVRERPLVINFDAHLDVRDLSRGITSGTPFFRLRTHSKNFDMIQVGIQNQCNALHHLEWCRDNDIEVLFLNEFYGKKESLAEVFERRFKNHLDKKRSAFISIDIDGFSHAYAPGCSQSWPTGIEPRDFFPLLQILMDALDVKLLSLYEVSPPLDLASATSKLAAQIAYRFLEASCLKN
jgi:formiminoglutamase